MRLSSTYYSNRVINLTEQTNKRVVNMSTAISTNQSWLVYLCQDRERLFHAYLLFRRKTKPFECYRCEFNQEGVTYEKIEKGEYIISRKHYRINSGHFVGNTSDLIKLVNIDMGIYQFFDNVCYTYCYKIITILRNMGNECPTDNELSIFFHKLIESIALDPLQLITLSLNVCAGILISCVLGRSLDPIFFAESFVRKIVIDEDMRDSLIFSTTGIISDRCKKKLEVGDNNNINNLPHWQPMSFKR